jgi:hypothetical protein
LKSLTDKIRIEMDSALASRAAGNEGRARVCARRAAGLAARDFLDRNHAVIKSDAQGSNLSNSAYAALQTLATYPGLSPELKQAASHLTTRVTPEFQLQLGIDLIDEAQKLIGGLL